MGLNSGCSRRFLPCRRSREAIPGFDICADEPAIGEKEATVFRHAGSVVAPVPPSRRIMCKPGRSQLLPLSVLRPDPLIAELTQALQVPVAAAEILIERIQPTQQVSIVWRPE